MKIYSLGDESGFGLAIPKCEGATAVNVSNKWLVMFDAGELSFIEDIQMKEKNRNKIIAKFAELIANNQ